MCKDNNMSSPVVKLAPSILAADFARLGEQVRVAEQAGADRIHVDVMDGHFVPNISMGPVVVKALRPITKLPLEVHLMIEHPIRFLDAFAEAGADSMLVHVENAANLHRTVQHIKALGKKAGVVLNPATSPIAVAEILPDVNLVLVMTVNPGFGGQAFIANTLGKVRMLRQMIDETKGDIELEVDGGIDAATTTRVVEAGARVLVAGSAIFGSPDGVAAAMNRLRNAILPIAPS
jgi:ribulose-phosphate 3-epimerase